MYKHNKHNDYLSKTPLAYGDAFWKRAAKWISRHASAELKTDPAPGEALGFPGNWGRWRCDAVELLRLRLSWRRLFHKVHSLHSVPGIEGIVLKLLQLFRVLPGSRFVECGGFCVVRFRRYFLDSSMVWETERPAKWESCIFGSIANGGLAFWIHRGGGGFRGGSTVTKNIMQ